MTRRSARAPVFRITGVRPALSEDVGSRQRRYLISMGIRTVCFLLAIVTSGWLRWVFFVAALVLPYFSVVIANGGREPAHDVPAALPDQDLRAIEQGPQDAARDRDHA
jgi:hypothetical protein